MFASGNFTPEAGVHRITELRVTTAKVAADPTGRDGDEFAFSGAWLPGNPATSQAAHAC
jgi:hypothetical protein